MTVRPEMVCLFEAMLIDKGNKKVPRIIVVDAYLIHSRVAAPNNTHNSTLLQCSIRVGRRCRDNA
jgi:hypothetical protein